MNRIQTGLRLVLVSAFLALAWASSPVRADLNGECSEICNSQSSCDQPCFQFLEFSTQQTTCGGYGSCQGSTRYEFEAEQPAEGYYDCWSSCSYLFGLGLQSCSYTQSGTRLYVSCIY